MVENSIIHPQRVLSLSVNIHSFNFYDDLILRGIFHREEIGDWMIFGTDDLYMDVNCLLQDV